MENRKLIDQAVHELGGRQLFLLLLQELQVLLILVRLDYLFDVEVLLDDLVRVLHHLGHEHVACYHVVAHEVVDSDLVEVAYEEQAERRGQVLRPFLLRVKKQIQVELLHERGRDELAQALFNA